MKKVTYLLVGLLVIIALAVVVVPVVLEEPIKKAVKEVHKAKVLQRKNFVKPVPRRAKPAIKPTA